MTSTDDQRVINLPTESIRQGDVPIDPPPPHGPGHSDIFERLNAHDESDLVGLVAYGLYQRRKRAWITAFHSKFGRFPDSEQRAAYAFGYREGDLNGLRASAEGALAAFGEQVVEQQIDVLRENALSAQTQAVLTGIDSRIGKLGSYWHHIVGHLVGFVILVGIVALGTLVVRFEPTVEGAYHWLFEDKKPTPPGNR